MALIQLSFDDGPLFDHGPDHEKSKDPAAALPKILSALKAHGARADFYINGNDMENPNAISLLQSIHSAGHICQNHSYTHTAFDKLSDAELKESIVKTNEVIQRVTGFYPNRVRPPYGTEGYRGGTARLRRILAELNMTLAMWDVDTVDWQSPMRPRFDAIIEDIEKTAKRMSIVDVLMHVRDSTASDLPELMERIAVTEHSIMKDYRGRLSSPRLRRIYRNGYIQTR